ncbi:hypothetical protein HMPREF1248_1021 [Coriobacteriaceae bacterium BV3Ac1]|nr:hypothetical protein HMPREF1248_1021 [Coriobacteriaceae bacterium BV3Ac1]
MFSKNFSRETGIPRPAKHFRKHRRATRLPRPPSLSTLVRPPEPERQPRHKAKGQRGEPPENKEVNHVRTQAEGHQGSGNLPRPSRLRGHRHRVGVRGRRLHRRGGARRGRDRVLRRAGPQGRREGNARGEPGSPRAHGDQRGQVARRARGRPGQRGRHHPLRQHRDAGHRRGPCAPKAPHQLPGIRNDRRHGRVAIRWQRRGRLGHRARGGFPERSREE